MVPPQFIWLTHPVHCKETTKGRGGSGAGGVVVVNIVVVDVDNAARWNDKYAKWKTWFNKQIL